MTTVYKIMNIRESMMEGKSSVGGVPDVKGVADADRSNLALATNNCLEIDFMPRQLESRLCHSC